MSTLKRIIKNAGYVFLGDNALKILSMLLVFLIARYLGDAEYGQFSFVLSFTGLFFILMDLGTRVLLIREIAQNKKEGSKIVSNVILLKLSVSAIVYVCIVALSLLLGYENIIIFAIALAALGVVFDSLATTSDAVFQAYERMEFPATLKVLRILLRFAITLPLLLTGAGFFSVLGAYVLVQFLNLVISFTLAYRHFIRISLDFDVSLIRHLLRKSFPFLLSGIFVTIYFRIDITLMSMLAPELLSGFYAQASRNAVIGWYSAAYNILDGLISIPIALSAAILPVAVVYFKESREKLVDLFYVSVKYLTYLSLPAAVGISILAGSIISLIYGEQYANAALALQILVWTLIPLYINYILGVINIAIHREKEAVAVLFANSLINISLNLILIPKYSLYGAAAATIISELFYFAGYYYLTAKYLVRINLPSILAKPLMSSLAMGGVIFLFRDANLFVLVFMGISIYFLLMYMLKAFSVEDIALIKKIVRR
jgi:O-antigen/teichoic acid export membrane protein